MSMYLGIAPVLSADDRRLHAGSRPFANEGRMEPIPERDGARPMTAGPTVSPTDTFTIQRMGAEEGPYSLADLQAQVRSGSVKYNTLVRRGDSAWFNATEVPGLFSDKEWLVALLLSLVLGYFGVDR